jgi:pimeloyl-ACP methyl ester carboxylesterase
MSPALRVLRSITAMMTVGIAVNAHAIQAAHRSPPHTPTVAPTEDHTLEFPRADQVGTFTTHEVEIHSGTAKLAGSLYLPQSSLPVPAGVFIHGAGPAVRGDGYRELAEHFVQNGVAALIFDKRGCGASEGDWTRASLSDLADDALAWVRFLRGRPEIDPHQIGLWGLSQGASIAPIAAGRSAEVSFVLAVGGCMDFEEALRYFRANVFRRAGYSPTLLDIANKATLIQFDLSNKIRAGVLPVPSAWRGSHRFEFDLDHEAIWRLVHQPVLAIYGELDRQVPAATSSAKLAAVMARSGNRDFTLVFYPGASHSLGQTRTGELGEEWIGYDPQYLQDMTDWIQWHATGRKTVALSLHRGQPKEAVQPFTTGHYERTRWFGNSLVQLSLLLMFVVGFFATTIAGTITSIRRMMSIHASKDAGPTPWIAIGAATLGILNLVVLTGLIFLVRGLVNAWDPAYPRVLNYLPLLGSLSALVTVLWLAILYFNWRAPSVTRRTRIAWTLCATCAIAFLPYLFYWNVLGLDLR